MGGSPFQSGLATHRVVTIPKSLEGDARARFIAKVAAAVKQQAALAAKSIGVLSVSEDLIHDGDRILIPHEPASPLDPAFLETDDDRPDAVQLWWWSWATTDAIDHASAEGIVHGGVQSGALFCDETGRIKLGDFGIAPIYESVCGIELRRQIHCDPLIGAIDGRATSGRWELLDEDAAREFGWIAPYFGHELLDGRQPLNPKADQFALGTLLFLLASGTHPYAASLSDPTLSMYFHLEPYEIRDERPDWAEIFERADQEFNTSADETTLAWGKFIRTLLASDPGLRFGPGGASKAAAAAVPAAWGQAAAKLRSAEAALREGDAEQAVTLAREWVDRAELPEAWRARLSAWYQRTEEQKELIARLRKLRLRLREGQEALDLMSIDEAVKIAEDVAAAPEVDDELRRQCDELLQGCEEQRNFIESGADELAKAYLESAAEYLEQERLAEARQIFEGVLGDPATPAPRAKQARQRLAEVELIEQRIENQTRVLNDAADDLRGTRYEAARERLETLLAEAEVTEAISTQAQLLLDDAIRSQELFTQSQAALQRAGEAWERAAADEMAEQLEAVDAAFANPTISAALGKECERLAVLRDALRKRDEASAALEAERVDEALKSAEAGLAIAEQPEVLRTELTEAAARCREMLEQRRQELLAEAREILERAEAAWQSADAAKLREQLAAFPEGVEESDLRARRDALVKRVAPLESALKDRAEAQELLASGVLESALTAAQRGAKHGELPTKVADELAALVQACEEKLEQRRRERVATAGQAQEAAEQAWSDGRLAEAAKRVREDVLSVREIDEALRTRAKQVLADCELAQEVVKTLDDAERGIAQEDFDTADALLNPLSPAGLPTEIAERIDALRRESGARRAAYVATREGELVAQLEEAGASLARGDLDGVETVVAGVESSAHVTPELMQRAEGLRAAVEQQRSIEATLAAVEKSVAEPAFQPEPAADRLATLPDDLPDWAASRAEEVRKLVAARIDKMRRQRSQLVASLFEAAEAAVEQCDLERATRKLNEITSGMDLDDSFARRRDAVVARMAELQPRVERVAQLESQLQAGEIADVHREATALKSDASLPSALHARIEKVLEGTSDFIRLHREQVDAALAELVEELQARGRRARRFEEHCATIEDDQLATKAQRQSAAELHAQYVALPEPKRNMTPLYVAGGIAAVALVAIGLAMSGVFSGAGGGGSGGGEAGDQDSQPVVIRDDTQDNDTHHDSQDAQPTPDPDGPHMAATLERLRGEFDGLRAAAAQDERLTPPWRLEFDPPAALPSALVAARDDVADRVELGRANDRAALGDVRLSSLSPDLYEKLFPPDPAVLRAREAATRAALVERIDAEVERLQAALDQRRPPNDDDPRFVLVLLPDREDEPLPGRLVARSGGDGSEIELADIETFAVLSGLRIRDDWVAALYPPPSAADRLSEALGRVTTQLAAARDRAGGESRRVSAYELRFEPADALPTTLVALDAESGETVELAGVTAASLDGLSYDDAWTDRLFPEMVTAGDLRDAYVEALRAALGEADAVIGLAGDGDSGFTAQVRWRDRDLLPLSGLTADVDAERIEPSPDVAAAHFAAQIAALRSLFALDGADPAKISLDPAYDERIRIVQQLEAVRIAAVDAENLGVEITTTARLDGDPRADATFALSGSIAADVLDAQSSRAAFAEYLAELQSAARAAALERVRAAAGMPAGLRWDWDAPDADSPTLRITTADGALLAEAPAMWNVAELTYSVESSSLERGIAAEIEKLAAAPAVRAAVAAQANALRESLAASDGSAGATFLRRCDVLSAEPAGAFDADAWRMPYEVTIAPPNARPEERLTCAASAAWENGRMAAKLDASAGDAIQRQLRELAANPSYRTQRFDEAVRQYAATANIDAATLRPQLQGDVARVELPNDSQTEFIEWTWSVSDLRFGAPRKIARATPPPPPPVRDIPQPPRAGIAALAAKGDVSADELAAALVDITQQKIARYGGGSYAVSSALTSGGDGTQRLLEISRAIQRQAAVDVTRDPFPTVFVEYVVAGDGVYGLSWTVTSSGGNSLSSVRSTRVRRVLSSAEVSAIGSPEDFRARYASQASLGEQLLGWALDNPLAGVGGSFGVAIAPDGPLWLTRWEQVRLSERDTSGIDDREAGGAGRVEMLRGALRADRTRGDRSPWRRGGLWVLPTLAGVWSGGDSLRLNLGEIASGARPGVAVFKQYVPSGASLAAIEDPTSRRNDWEWPTWIKSAERSDLGTTFWDRDWEGDGYHAGKTRSLAIVVSP